MKKILFFLLPILFLGGCAVGTKLPQLNLTHHTKNVDYPVGQKFQVVLPSNQTTGYKWELDDITAGVLEKVSDEYQLSDKYKENVVGAGGEEIWTFKVLKVERSHIVMKYRRPWDKIDVANNFLLTINGNPGDDGLLTYVGKIQGSEEGTQFDDCFVTGEGDKFGIVPYMVNKLEDPGVKAKIAEFRGIDKLVEIHGALIDSANDCNGKQFIIREIKEK